MKDYVVRDLFPTPLYVTQLTRGLTDEEVLFITDNSEQVKENTHNYQSLNVDVLEDTSMKNIKNFVLTHVNNYKEEVMSISDNVEFYITQSWLNYTNESQAHHEHYHPNSIISGVLYLATDEEDSITFVKDHHKDSIMFSTPKKINSYNSNTSNLKVGNGLLILFPSNITHRVSPKKGDNTRISLAFNTFFRGELNMPVDLQYLKI
jgi:uncharacterized protein (TIGR02466 family)